MPRVIPARSDPLQAAGRRVLTMSKSAEPGSARSPRCRGAGGERRGSQATAKCSTGPEGRGYVRRRRAALAGRERGGEACGQQGGSKGCLQPGFHVGLGHGVACPVRSPAAPPPARTTTSPEAAGRRQSKGRAWKSPADSMFITMTGFASQRGKPRNTRFRDIPPRYGLTRAFFILPYHEALATVAFPGRGGKAPTAAPGALARPES